MKQRILVAVVGIPALLAVLCIAPAWATALLLAALTVIAAHELLTAVCGPDKARRWTVLPAVCGVLLLARAVWPGCAALEGLLLAAALTLPLSGVLTYGKPHALTFTDVCAMAAAGFAIPWAFSGLYGLRTLDNGYLLVLTPLVAAFCSDALALFTGMALGRHKLAPLVSPHKTVEGALGGLAGGMAGMAVFCAVFRAMTHTALSYSLCIALGLLGAVLGELGDLSFSAVKRQYGIKDYGRLLPGHGGVLDRFDSGCLPPRCCAPCCGPWRRKGRASMTKTISLLGSTGSIGRQTLQVARELGLTVAALTANRQVDLLERQAREFHPQLAVLYDRDAARQLRLRLSDTDIRVAEGPEGLLLAAQLPQADTVVTAVMGSVGLEPTLAAIRQKKRIALANKETLVCAGELVMAQAERWGADIVPVDSEHSAIFQSLQGCRDRNEVRRLLLTCSGGPFFGRSFRDLEGVTPADALKHPNWSMGAKITIDSATLMNKGLEVIEAMRLYRLPVEQVDVVIHRQSIVHSLVEYRDGAMIAQLGTPDMKLPIRYAFTWPHRAPSPDTPLDLLTCGDLTFRAPDLDAFPCLRIARQCAKAGGTACAIMNGANEAAVALFLQERVGFNDIPRLVESALSRVEVKYAPDLPDILEADRQARAAVLQTVGDMV